MAGGGRFKIKGGIASKREAVVEDGALLVTVVGGVGSGFGEDFYDGAVIETIDIDVVEDTGTVELQLQADGGGDLTFRFDSVSYTLDCTPACEVTLTVGTDVAPQINFVYVTEAAGVLTLVNDTTGFPSGPFAPIATVFVQSAAGVAADGAFKVHAWTDHVSSSGANGHLSHVNAKLRAFNATWISGVAPSDLVVSDPDAFISTTAGVVFQLHEHTMPAIDMQTPAPIWLLNDPTTAYKRVTTFDDITQDASGNGINNKYMNLVLWGVVSEDEPDCKLFINLPTDVYVVEASAQADTQNTSVFSFPDEFVGTAFLIARYTVQAKDSGAWVQSQKVDLRGLAPSTSAGGGGITDHGSLAGLLDDDHTQYILVDGTRAFTGDVEIVIDDAVDAGVTQALRLTHLTIGTPAVGIGVGLEFEVETTAGTEVGGVIEFVATDVAAGSEDFDLVIRSMAGGAPASERMRLTSEAVLSVGDFRVFQDADVNLFLGENAGNFTQVGAVQNIGIGQLSLGDLTSGDSNVGIGHQALRLLTTGSNNVAIGASSMLLLTTGSNNVAIGLNALANITTGGRNVGIGERALQKVTEANANTAVGRSSLSTLTTASDCTAFGNVALLLATGQRNTGVGSTAGQNVTTGTNNTFVGVGAGFSNGSGVKNVGVGDGALSGNVGGSSNTCLGFQAGEGAGDAIGRNICIGFEAGHDLVGGGDNNIIIGYRAGDNATSGDTNIVIGYQVNTPSATSSQTMTIGNLIFAENIDGEQTTISTGNLGIAVISPTSKLHVVQASATGAMPVLTLDQGDVSEEMMEFLCTIGSGNAIEVVEEGVSLTTTHFIKVTITGGLTRYFPVGTIA